MEITKEARKNQQSTENDTSKADSTGAKRNFCKRRKRVTNCTVKHWTTKD